MSVDLLTPILDDGIEHNHFFEGRLLSGRDLRDEQTANRLNREQLGRAIGAGIVEGLVVSQGADANDGSPVLTVTEGLAFNRKGQPLELPKRTDIRLIRELGDIPEDAGVFRNCSNVLNTLVPSGIGIYILVMSPSSGFTESAPMSGLGEGGKVAGCGKRYEVEGVQFRLEKLNPSEVSGISSETRTEVTGLLAATDTADRSMLRNLTAHMCFGTESLATAAGQVTGNPASTSPYAAYGALDDLLAVGTLTECDVPLGLFFWSLGGVGFLDMWSVRRRVFPLTLTVDLGTVAAARRRAEGEAILLQFQNHVEGLRSTLASPAGAQARDYFRYLPAAGLLTVSGPTAGFAASSFFLPLPHRSTLFVNGEQLQEIFRRSLHYDPIDLRDAEMVWIYRPWQQEPALANGTASRSYIVFTSGHMPLYATARFDVSRWDFSNYSTCCD